MFADNEQSVYAGAARVNVALPGSEDVDYSSLSHMVLFIEMGDGSPETYLVDVGFGGQGPARAIPLRDGSTVKGAAVPETHRIIRTTHPKRTARRDQPVEWALQVGKMEDEQSWRSLYLFSSAEFGLKDFAAFNFVVNKGHSGPFAAFVVVVAIILAENSRRDDLDGDLDRIILFGNSLKVKHAEEVCMQKEIDGDRERADILRNTFHLDVEDTGHFVDPEVGTVVV